MGKRYKMYLTKKNNNKTNDKKSTPVNSATKTSSGDVQTGNFNESLEVKPSSRKSEIKTV